MASVTLPAVSGAAPVTTPAVAAARAAPASSAGAAAPLTGPRGHDVSSHQKDVDWTAARANGSAFAYVKATESTTYRSPVFREQYDGARAAGILRGAYHFAVPDRSSGAAQAAYFVRNGGAWRADGRTLPPALDVEYNPYGKQECYGLGGAAMVRWIRSFSDELERLTGRRPVIYTTAHWWRLCTGDSTAFAADHALWIARQGTDSGALPGGWPAWTFWQYGDDGPLPGDQDVFNGSAARLGRFARG